MPHPDRQCDSIPFLNSPNKIELIFALITYVQKVYKGEGFLFPFQTRTKLVLESGWNDPDNFDSNTHSVEQRNETIDQLQPAGWEIRLQQYSQGLRGIMFSIFVAKRRYRLAVRRILYFLITHFRNKSGLFGFFLNFFLLEWWVIAFGFSLVSLIASAITDQIFEILTLIHDANFNLEITRVWRH